MVEQGEYCVSVVPLSGDVPIEERNGWTVEGADFSATGLVGLQRPDTSVLFLYDGPNGLSLVVVHDEYGDGTDGGSVTFEFAGLPPDGQWVVQDDYYDGESKYDQWRRDGTDGTVDWTWGESRTDGGAFRGLGPDPDLALRIDPSFNADATLYGACYDGELTAWEVVPASADGRTRTTLALDEPIVVRRGSCSTDDGEESEDDESTDDREVGDDSEEEGDEEEEEEEEEQDDDDDQPGKREGHEKDRGKGNGHDGTTHPGKGNGYGESGGEGRRQKRGRGMKRDLQ
ncbi:MAG: hypothetical protein ACOCQL_06790 [Halolamina sp.]